MGLRSCVFLYQSKTFLNKKFIKKFMQKPISKFEIKLFDLPYQTITHSQYYIVELHKEYLDWKIDYEYILEEDDDEDDDSEATEYSDPLLRKIMRESESKNPTHHIQYAALAKDSIKSINFLELSTRDYHLIVLSDGIESLLTFYFKKEEKQEALRIFDLLKNWKYKN